MLMRINVWLLPSLLLITIGSSNATFDVTPRNIHIAFTDQPASEMVISWLTQNSTVTSAVRYGSSPSQLLLNATGDQIFYLNGTAGYNHHVTLRNLSSDTKYYYSCGDSSNSSWSSVFEFQTTPAKFRPLRIPMYGDMGTTNANSTMERLLEYVDANPIDFIYHVGDISYADDWTEVTYEGIWDAFFADMQPIMPRIPYMVCPGNHEAVAGPDMVNCTSQNFTAYRYRFRMPGEYSNMWYSWNFLSVHFIALSTETDFPNSPEGWASFGEQLEWLENDLSTVDITLTPWIVVVGHRPMYSSAVNYSASGVPVQISAAIQSALEALFYRYHVDLFVSGHVHAYERQFPVYDSVAVGDLSDPQRFVDPPAPIYIVAGAGGSPEALSNPDNSNWEPQPKWCAHRFGDDYGFGVLQVYNNSALQWQYFRSGDGGIEDQFWIVKTNAKKK